MYQAKATNSRKVVRRHVWHRLRRRD
jgi:hypothetical protein